MKRVINNLICRKLLVMFLILFLTGCTVNDQLGTTKNTEINREADVTIAQTQAELELTKVAEHESAKVKIAEINANSAIVIAKDTNSSNVQIASINGKSTMDAIFWIVLALIIISGIIGFFYSRKPTIQLPQNFTLSEQRNLIEAQQRKMLRNPENYYKLLQMMEEIKNE